MSSNVPVVRSIAWPSVIVQLIIVALLSCAFFLAKISEPFLCGAITYSALAFALRYTFSKHHRAGMKLVKQMKFTEAIPHFEKSVDYFTRNSWVDKYRVIVLFNSGKMSYKEMGLCNLGFCYSQIGNGEMAKKYYTAAITEFPQSGVARVALNMLNSTQNTSNEIQ